MGPPILPPFDGRCTRYAPTVKCQSRRDAQAAGEFFFSYQHKGWLLGEDRMVSSILRAEHKAPFIFEWCPYCGGALPDFSTACDPAAWKDPPLPPTQADGSDTEDGG